MKAINYQCLYLVDDARYLYTAFNQDGSLCGFINPPVRDFQAGIWVDSVTGGCGELILFDRWDTSMREPKDFVDTRTPHLRKGTKVKPATIVGKKRIFYHRDTHEQK